MIEMFSLTSLAQGGDKTMLGRGGGILQTQVTLKWGHQGAMQPFVLAFMFFW